MNIALWITQGILALIYSMAGAMKVSQPIDKLVKTVSWADRFPLTTVRFIGTVELLGAIGLIIPWALEIVPLFTPVAASGLALIMVLAIFHHAKHKEPKAIAINITLLALGAFIAFGRFKSL
jgi:uncharacterized membrane protein YphA (DoxX/SURF4 family)